MARYPAPSIFPHARWYATTRGHESSRGAVWSGPSDGGSRWLRVAGAGSWSGPHCWRPRRVSRRPSGSTRLAGPMAVGAEPGRISSTARRRLVPARRGGVVQLESVSWWPAGGSRARDTPTPSRRTPGRRVDAGQQPPGHGHDGRAGVERRRRAVADRVMVRKSANRTFSVTVRPARPRAPQPRRRRRRPCARPRGSSSPRSYEVVGRRSARGRPT